MTLPAPTYDLTLLLDPDADEAARAKIVADARAAIEARGELERYDEWGTRPLSYPIDRKRAAEYYLLQFHAQTPELLSDLQRSLRITDGVLRFRLIKLKPGVPAAPEMRVGPPASRGEGAPSRPVQAHPAAEEVVEIEVVELDEPASDTAAQADAGEQAHAPVQEEAPASEAAPTQRTDSAAQAPDGTGADAGET